MRKSLLEKYKEEIKKYSEMYELTIKEEISESTNLDKILCETKEGYCAIMSLHRVRNNGIPSIFNTQNPYTLYNVEVFIKVNNLQDKISLKEGQFYKGMHKKLTFVCNKHGEYKRSLSSFMHNGSVLCNKCSTSSSWKGLCDENRLSLFYPDLVKYFKNKEEADNYTVRDFRRVNLICPDCGYEKEMKISNLSIYGFSCNQCSDGISIPEKFCRGILNQLNIEYETEKSFDWSEKKRYDFYIKELNIIIETHGGQHYYEVISDRYEKLSVIQANDQLKYTLAKGNDIDKYIVIDCSKSDFLFLKESFISKLGGYFNLNNIIWENVYLFCLRSIVLTVCKLWNEKSSSDSNIKIKEIYIQISKEVKLNPMTVKKYINMGIKAGIVPS